MIDRLRERFDSWSPVADYIREDDAITEVVREVALRLITVRAEDERRNMRDVEEVRDE